MATPRNWILLRGLARGVGHWGSFVETLKSRFPNDNFELIDIPGNGLRCRETSPTSIPEYVKDMRSRSEFVRKGESFNLLAVSLGGMITVEWVREFPHEVTKAFVVCTSSATSPFHQRLMVSNYANILSLMTAKRDAAQAENVILNMIVNNHERREGELPQMIQFSKEHPVQLANVLRQLLAASRYRFPDQPPGDIKVIGSHGDRLVSPTCTLKIAEAWGIKPVMHSWAGHDLPIDDPQWLIEQLL
ncbi:MAG TPA: alpha/beta hydrolase [Bdellovibrio sp.]